MYVRRLGNQIRGWLPKDTVPSYSEKEPKFHWPKSQLILFVIFEIVLIFVALSVAQFAGLGAFTGFIAGAISIPGLMIFGLWYVRRGGNERDLYAQVAGFDLILGLAFLIFGSAGFLLQLSGFTPTAVVFVALGLVLVLVFWQSRRRGYPSPVPKTTSFATVNIGQEEKLLLRVVLKSGYPLGDDQVSVLVDGKEVSSSRWTFGRRREYDLSVGQNEKHQLKLKLSRGLGGPKYELYADGNLIGEGKLQPDTQNMPTT